MAFPVVESITPSSQGSDASSITVAMPATVNAGDLLILIFARDGHIGVITGPAGWTEITDLDPAGAVAGLIWAKDADGTEGGTTVSVSWAATSEQACAQVYRISGWHGTLADGVYDNQTTGTTADDEPNPPNLVTGLGALDYLWIAGYIADDDDGAPTYPTSYTDGTFTRSATGTGTCSIATAQRDLNASSEDPGVFVMTASEEHRAFTLAILPVAGDPPCTPAVISVAPTVSYPGGLNRAGPDAPTFVISWTAVAP